MSIVEDEENEVSIMDGDGSRGEVDEKMHEK